MQPGTAPAPASTAIEVPPPSGKQTQQTAVVLLLLALVLGLYGLSQLWGAVDWLFSLGLGTEPFVRAGKGIVGLAVAAGAAYFAWRKLDQARTEATAYATWEGAAWIASAPRTPRGAPRSRRKRQRSTPPWPHRRARAICSSRTRHARARRTVTIASSTSRQGGSCARAR